MSPVIITPTNRPLQTLARNTHPPHATKDSGLLHIHVIPIETRRAMRNQDMEINKIFHCKFSFYIYEYCSGGRFGAVSKIEFFQQAALVLRSPVIELPAKLSPIYNRFNMLQQAA
jgi:hypothetical protein